MDALRDLICDSLNNKSYFADGCDLEMEKSEKLDIERCLMESQSLVHGVKRPDFIISNRNSDIVLIISLGLEISKHASANIGMNDRALEYTLDRSVLYGKALVRTKNVVAIGITMENDVTTYSSIAMKKGNKGVAIIDGEELKRYNEYKKYFDVEKKDATPKNTRIKEVSTFKNTQYDGASGLSIFAKELNNLLRDFANMTQHDKPLLVGAVLIALEDEDFCNKFKSNTSCYMSGNGTPEEIEQAKSDKFFYRRRLAYDIMSSVENKLRQVNVPQHKLKALIRTFKFIESNNNILENCGNTFLLYEVVDGIKDKIYAHIKDNYHMDMMGKFYNEFISYSNADSSLGIVLTPDHVAHLMAKLLNLDTNSVVLDPCTGTGRFLVAAMNEMINKANGDEELEQHIKTNNLVGCELQDFMYAMACSNMIFNKDGRSNIYLGSCFDGTIGDKIKELKPNCGIINPPYSQKQKDMSELHFIENMLSLLEEGSYGVAIVPMSCAIDTKKSVLENRQRIMRNHSLVAVMSMPDEVFYPTATVTCIMVFKAHEPHNKNNKTWFGYWKNDGFVKTKNEGRIDLNNTWDSIEEQWLNDYFGKVERPGHSVLASVGPADEWCAEAYMQTDYSTLTKEMFEAEIKKYAIYKMMAQV